MNSLRKIFQQNADIAIVLLVVGVLIVLFTPIPSQLLDFLILANFSFALLILVLTFYMPKPVEFSTFPALLLIATLFRLSLNVAATRLILGSGDAGRVIGAVGNYVIGGNYAIGLIVFLILIVVQYVVVTNGAQRVSEVAARFTLDSMPGQQMSIDADLNMGFIDQEEAKRRRKNLEKEAGFYGAMDGASKFVKGDAIAGIIIMLINIIGGLVIGVMQMGMPWGQALQTFTLLTIGDGIVTQVPALVISVGTGIIVTRSASDANLGQEVLKQLGSFPKTLLLVAAALGGLLMLPGIPVIPGAALALLFVFLAWLSRQNKLSAPLKDTEDLAEEVGQQDAYAELDVEPIEIYVASNLGSLLSEEQPVMMERIAAFRTQYAGESGLVLPSLKIREAGRLGQNLYEIAIFGVVVARGELMPGHTMAIHAGGNPRKLNGIETKDPTYGLAAVWIEDDEKESARLGKYTLVDAATVFITHLCETLRQQSATLLTRAETERLIERVRQKQVGLVEEIVPTLLSIGEIQRVMQSLLKEKVSVRHLQAVLETLADAAKVSKDLAYLTEAVRQRLGPMICQALVNPQNVLQVLMLDPSIEFQLSQGLQAAEGRQPTIDPKLTETVMRQLAQQVERMMKSNLMPVLLCAPELRRHIRTLSERMMPHLRVISLLEVPSTVELRAFASVTIQ
ncbi:flagellar biosynthesis protein FlhA [Chitinimonas sp. BJB300]|uniref:flagellar biosynthesis protein FlhA n=1 Tax=Chitinimonas sp. BJB300 TaxID=1559339 RepID=UPI000C10BF20|nr:flagellar biosynthesis protein FlhA [Chitinimonas sp. BJB300]PHV12882.1 flagellar biosynthesis protein FlhA [Chitinimonas sp. BJB300]TSJ86085.1 FHIPEP family type III secretion protein [Chitinimonas sp. BJB300]